MNLFTTYEAYNPKELLAGLEEKFGGGAITLLIYALDIGRDLFSNGDKTNKKIDQKLKLYKVKKMTDEGLLLSLRQLDY